MGKRQTKKASLQEAFNKLQFQIRHHPITQLQQFLISEDQAKLFTNTKKLTPQNVRNNKIIIMVVIM